MVVIGSEGTDWVSDLSSRILALFDHQIRAVISSRLLVHPVHQRACGLGPLDRREAVLHCETDGVGEGLRE